MAEKGTKKLNKTANNGKKVKKINSENELIENKTANDGKKISKFKKKVKKTNSENELIENKTVNDGKKVSKFKKKVKKTNSENELIENLKQQYNNIEVDKINSFSDFPLSVKTLKALRECGYHKPTDIQKATIGLALKGDDILAAAHTGSGKTLAFLIPILERLFCLQWSRLDGLGTIVITPTRELAYQIFEALRRIGQYHDFSAGLIIGGKDLKFERNRMDQCNIVICTPGRLLQHMDENPLFNCENLQILVLDEADRCLDMGFEATMNAVIANLPEKRQTLLFSATQTKSVKDLVRLSLKDPNYVSVHENSEFSTPEKLQQSYVECELEQKISILWSFIKNHLKQKIIIFFSSCKQVKYVYEIFCKLRPGTSLLALYGTLHQLRRMDIYETFCRKSSAVLFATDLAARGLDFPEVHWVVQADCPEDPATYIHRVGRTARYHSNGESLLLLLSSELAMVEKLSNKKIPLKKIEINPLKLNNPVRKIEAFLARDPSLKETAQRAFVSYAKAVFLMKDKSVFNVQKLNTDAFAHSLGLAIPPRIRFLQRIGAKQKLQKEQSFPKALNKKITFDDGDEDESNDNVKQNFEKDDSEEEEIVNNNRNTFEMFNSCEDDEDENDDDNILQIKRRDHDIELPTASELEIAEMNSSSRKKKKAVTRAALAKKLLKKNIIPNKKIVFNEEGAAVVSGTKEKKSVLAVEYENEDVSGIDFEKARLVLKEEDKFDKQLFKEKVKAKHKEIKRKLKEEKKKKRMEANGEEGVDDFGENSDDEMPDLSWLPDPDKIYGPKDESVEEENESFQSKSQNINTKSDDIEVETHKRSKKRKGVANKEKKKKLKLENISSLTGNEAEELALLLLQK